ncbi:hypothetical protein QUB63_12240 [Microcoleus sp. ARI1-B5]
MTISKTRPGRDRTVENRGGFTESLVSIKDIREPAPTEIMVD